MSSVVGADGGGDVPARAGEPLIGCDVAGELRALLFQTADLKAAAKPPVVLRALGSAGWGDGVGEAAGFPGAGLTWTAPVIGLDGSCPLCSCESALVTVWLVGR